MSKVTLKPGDYVSTEGMRAEDIYKVAIAFFEAGASGFTGTMEFGTFSAMGWDERDNSVYSHEPHVFDRHLTIGQVLGSQDKERDEMAQDLIDNSLACTMEYAKVMAEQLLEAGYRKQTEPQEDLTDPANWRVGDYVTVEGVDCNLYDWWTKGKEYAVFHNKNYDSLCVMADDGDIYPVDGERLVRPGRFKFHHRPS